MVDTVHVSCSMERNRDIGAKDFYMVQMSSGEVEYHGTLNLQQVLTLVKEKYLLEAIFDRRSTMESSDDRSYLQVHLWRSTYRKMNYPKSLLTLSGGV